MYQLNGSRAAEEGERLERVVVSRRGAARWLGGHPWIYRSDVTAPPKGGAGAVLIREESGRVLGTALWSPTSMISLRMLTSEERPIDAGFWSERIGAAIRYRSDLAIDASAYRLVHSEADGLPSLVVDRYGDTLVVQLLSAGLEIFRDDIVAALVEHAKPLGILARNDVPVRRHEELPLTVETLWGTVPDEVEVKEGTVTYRSGLTAGQKTGAFLDQRENRERVAQLARGRTLDCFSYHGSFALHLARGATEVTAVDSSTEALARAEENFARNGFTHAHTREANVFDLLREEESAGARYDVVVLDPPAFAKRRDAIDKALRGYKEINLRAMRLLAPGGHLCTFSCSYHVGRDLFRQMLESAAADSGRPMRWIEDRGQASDHPVLLQVPESGYLKGAVLQAV